jgi:hypothetical protein
MNWKKILAVVLLVGGALGLAFGGFTYTKSIDHTQVGPFSMTVRNRQTVPIPLWAGLAGVLLGGALLLFPGRKA